MSHPQVAYRSVDGRIGFAGQPLSMRPEITHLRAAGELAEQWTMVVGSANDSTVHTWTITDDETGEAYTLTYTSGTSATTTTIAAGIAAATNAHAQVSGFVRASSSTATVTFDGREPNYAFTVTESDSNLNTPTNVQAAAEAGSIPFGVAVLESAFGECSAPSTSHLAFKVVTATPTNVNSEVYSLGVRIKDEDNTSFFSQITADGTATVQEIVEAMVAALNAHLEGLGAGLSVAATEDNTKITLTSEQRGLDFDVVAGNSATAVWTIATTTDAGVHKFRGVAAYLQGYEPSTTTGLASYPGRSQVRIVEKGIVRVKLDAGISPSLGDPVYYRHTASATETAGAFRDAADSTDCVYLANARWRSAGYTGLDGQLLADLELL